MNGEAYGSRPEKRGVIVGIDNYQDTSIGDLAYTTKDAESFHDILVDPRRGEFTQVCACLITNRNKDESLRPLRSNIMAATRAMSRSAGSEDTILFFFSGHGIEIDRQAYLIPYDARSNILSETALPISWIKKAMAQSDAKGKVIILDACHAGLLLGKAAAQPMTKAFEQAIFEEAEGFAILASCKMNELSHEWKEKEHGVFTYFLNEGLLGLADADRDGVVTVSEASRYVMERVKNWAFENHYQQNPTLEYRVSGDIPLVHVPKEITEAQVALSSSKVLSRSFEKSIVSISLLKKIEGHSSAEVFERFASQLSGLLLNYFPSNEIREVENAKTYTFPAGEIRRMTEGKLAYIELMFHYHKDKPALISRIISDLDQLDWTELRYEFNKWFDLARTASWLRSAGMTIVSYEPGAQRTKNLLLTASSIGWGREGVAATLVFRNSTKGSRLSVIQRNNEGLEQMESNFFDKFGAKNVMGQIGNLLVDIK